MEAKATLAARGTALDSGDPAPFWRNILLSGRAGRGGQPLLYTTAQQRRCRQRTTCQL